MQQQFELVFRRKNRTCLKTHSFLAKRPLANSCEGILRRHSTGLPFPSLLSMRKPDYTVDLTFDSAPMAHLNTPSLLLPASLPPCLSPTQFSNVPQQWASVPPLSTSSVTGRALEDAHPVSSHLGQADKQCPWFRNIHAAPARPKGPARLNLNKEHCSTYLESLFPS